jgi:hypothetical protein
MNKKRSKYSSTKNLKITYYLGAGASFNSIPILNMQGYSMIKVAQDIQTLITSTDLLSNENFSSIHQNLKLTNLAKDIESFGNKAQEYGSIDIYARRLYLLDQKGELEKLKFCLSVFFDIWENFSHSNYRIGDHDVFNPKIDNPIYNQIDKRYFSLLSVLLDKGELNPKLNDRVSFISWNYDLQLEMTYRSFMKDDSSSLEQINSSFKFMYNNTNIEKSDVIHLNGYRGVFKHENKIYPNVEKTDDLTFYDYLLGIIDNYEQFKRPNPTYKDCIKYAWEADSSSLEKAKKIMRETDILVVIGYSFPSFNREVDVTLIKEFEKKSSYEVIYQDPNANQDLIDSLFMNPENVDVKRESPLQFYIPPEFLSPSDAAEPKFGLV